MIRYKIVNPNRESIFAYGKYSLEYQKGDIISKIGGTLGIFTFKRYYQAVNFLNKCYGIRGLILKVKCFGRGKVPLRIAGTPKVYMLNEFYNGTGVTTRVPPLGTICYDKIEVLE